MMAVMGPATQCWAIYGVRISDLHNTPLPTGQIRVWGKVTSESPLTLTDGRGEITVTGRTATLNEYLAVDGWSNGQFFSVFESEMIYIPAGDFQMGNSGVGYDATYGFSHEFPQHSVYLSGYYIGKYEVTRGEYRAFMTATGRGAPHYWDAVQNYATGNFTQTDSYPVGGVTYYDAAAFCAWAGGHLPTEAQWERAARWTGSHPNVYPWGDAWGDEKCNNYYDSNSAGGGYRKYQTSPVGSYSSYPSPSGCQDMAGNVWEWCQDWYGSTYYSTSPSSNPQGPTSGSYFVLRGGGYSEEYRMDRCAYRLYDNPYEDRSHRGFRLAR